jgi:hypothetical protein
MVKIRDIVQINSGYTSYVDLYEDYYDLAKNRGRMELYKPIAAHRQVFEKIANALNPLDRRFYFLSGSYGTGKSHLLLMLANYFASPSDVPELEKYFKNYEEAQNEVLLKPGETLKERKAASLKEARKSGRFLVALCRYSLNLDFEGALLRALEDALHQDDSSILLDTHYSEALRRIDDWQTRRNEARFYNDLELAISRLFPDWTINDLIDGLEQFDEQSLKAFKQCFRAVTDAEFTYNKDNLRDIISDFLKNTEFKANYKGIVFLYDEFGAAIDNGLVNYTNLLDFAQYCASSTMEKGGTVLFVSTGHKAFRNHGKIGDLNAETLEARVTEIGLQTQGMEDIISAIVQPNKDSTEWNQQVQPHSAKFTWFSNECNRLSLFSWLPAPKIKNNIIQNIYPMHPLATYALLKLAGEAGSDNRSVFKFFAPEFETGEQGWVNVQPNSYPWFLENHEVEEQGKLALYTSDALVDYFRESLKVTNNRLVDHVKTAVINYEATLRELNAYLARKSEGQLFEEADELMQRIIKVMLVNEIISNEAAPIANTAQNIEFALDAISPEEKTQVEDRLKLLSGAGVIYNNNGVYELMRGDRKDIQRLIEQFKANPDNRPTNLLEGFLTLNPLKRNESYLDARGYNDSYNEDKRLKVQFATPSMLTNSSVVDGETFSFFAALERERGQISNATTSYEGSAVYVFCETDAEVDAARKAAALNDQERVVVAIPRMPISVQDTIFTLKALESEWFKKQAESFGPFEKAEEKTIRDTAVKELNEVKKSYFSNAKVHWFGLKGIDIPAQEDKRHDAARLMMQKLYGDKRNTFGHNEFNKVHTNIGGQVKTVLFEAGNFLIDMAQPVRINWTWADNRGTTRYLRRCFVDQQALKVMSVEGDYRYLEPEKDLGKFRTSMPAYALMLEDLAALEGQGSTNFPQFIQPYFEEYGQGEIAVTLMLLLARRFYGDSLRFKREPNHLNDMVFSSTDEMLDLVKGKEPSAVVLFEAISVEDQAYFAKVTQIFTNQPASAGKTYTVNDAYLAVINWWSNLAIIARSLGFYEQDYRSLAEALSQAKTKDPFRFVKYDLLELLGQTPGEVLSEAKLVPLEVRMKAFKSAAEAIQSVVEARILQEIAKEFASPTHLDDDIKDAMKAWYTDLSSIQKDQMAIFHNNDSKPLIKYTGYANIRELLFIKLPEAYSLGSVGTWMSDYVSTYIQRIRNGKAHIETNSPEISTLKVDFDNIVGRKGNQVTYMGELTLHANTEDGQGQIYYTEDGSDPTNSRNRQQLTPGDTLTIKGNRKVKLTVADGQGNYSAIQTINAIDELEKYAIKRSAQQTTFDEAITFIFPKTKDAAGTTITTFIKTLKESGLYTETELEQAIRDALDALK